MSSRRSNFFLSATLGLGALTSAANAQTVTVTTTDDVVDFGGAQQVSDLPGSDGVVSFREACTAANNTAGPQTIAFAIPNTPSMEWSGGVAMLYMDFNIFVLSDDATTVDFSTQTSFTGDTNPVGNEVGIRTSPITGAPAIYVAGNHCTIRGLDRVSYCGHGVQLAGNHNRVVGCTIWGPLYSAVFISGGFGGAAATFNVVGGVLPGEGNTLSSGNDGVRIDAPADENVVVGNTLTGSYHGVAVRGSQFTSFPNNNRIGGPTVAERNLIAGAGKYGSEGAPAGAQVLIDHANGTLVEGNYIGTTADGMSPSPNQRAPSGVSVVDSTGTIVRGNTISGIHVVGINHYAGQLFGDGIRVMSINGPTSNTTIESNLIGTDPSGQVAVSNLYGIRLQALISSQPLTDSVVSGNIVASNERAGIVVADTAKDVRVSENSIFSNGDLGIDLLSFNGGVGVTANDPLDADSGGNGFQNYPDVVAAVLQGGLLNIGGVFHSEPNRNYTLEFFGSPACDGSGFGEGQLFLGSTAVSTDSAGDATFNQSVPAIVPVGWSVTATATRESLGATSEFSACVSIVDASAGQAFCFGDGTGTPCPCGPSGNPGEGCGNSSGVGGAALAAIGHPSLSSDTFTLQAVGVPGNKPGLILQGANWVNAGLGNSVGDGLLCTSGMSARSQVQITNSGSTSFDDFRGSPFGMSSYGAGVATNYQFWYRDSANTCSGLGFNFSNAWTVTWLP